MSASGCWSKFADGNSGKGNKIGQLKTKSTELVSGKANGDPMLAKSQRSADTVEWISSYSAVVGRKTDRGDNMNLKGLDQHSGNGEPCSSAGLNLISKNQIINHFLVGKKFYSEPAVVANPLKVKKREVGVQVNMPNNEQQTRLKTNRKSQTTIDCKDKGTITTERSQLKDQGVSAKLCVCSTSPLPVEFHGDHFKFENAVSQSVASLGITFLDFDDCVPIHVINKN